MNATQNNADSHIIPNRYSCRLKKKHISQAVNEWPFITWRLGLNKNERRMHEIRNKSARYMKHGRRRRECFRSREAVRFNSQHLFFADSRNLVKSVTSELHIIFNIVSHAVSCFTNNIRIQKDEWRLTP